MTRAPLLILLALAACGPAEPESAANMATRLEQEMEESGELLLLGAPRTAGVRFCCPVRPEPRFCP